MSLVTFEDLLELAPFSLPPAEKEQLLKAALKEELEHHFRSCIPYRRFCEKRGFRPPIGEFEYADLPYLPVGIFKEMLLTSVPQEEIVRTLHSSATTSQTPSTVVIDEKTRRRQMKALMWIMKERVGNDRRPFIIMDVDPAKGSRSEPTISARTAAVRGFLTVASSATYCMEMNATGELSVNIEALTTQLDVAKKLGQRPVLFGYTYILFTHVAKAMFAQGHRLNPGDATIVHIGGWKKLQSESVSRAVFNQALEDVLGVRNTEVIDVFGFTEQLGVVYPDGEDGLKRCSVVSEVLVRNPRTLALVPDGEVGLLEFITPLTHSYPGIAILLDDLGRIVTRERDPKGRWGTAFEVIGRAKRSDVRGCGDILSQRIAAPA